MDDLIFLQSSPDNIATCNSFEKEKLIIGHNVMFDRSFIAEQYLYSVVIFLFMTIITLISFDEFEQDKILILSMISMRTLIKFFLYKCLKIFFL